MYYGWTSRGRQSFLGSGLHVFQNPLWGLLWPTGRWEGERVREWENERKKLITLSKIKYSKLASAGFWINHLDETCWYSLSLALSSKYIQYSSFLFLAAVSTRLYDQSLRTSIMQIYSLKTLNLNFKYLLTAETDTCACLRWVWLGYTRYAAPGWNIMVEYQHYM